MSIRRVVPMDQAEWSVAPAPAWRKPRDIDWTFRAPAQDALVWLLIDEQHDVATQACARRWVRQLQTIAAVQGLGQIELEFEPDAQRLVVHELVVWRLDADGAWRKRTPVAADAFLLRQREQQLEQQMLNGHVSLVALLEDVRVGDVIDLAWTIELRDRLPGIAFTAYFGFAWRAAVAHAHVALHLSVDEPVIWRLHAGGDGPQPQESAGADCVEWTLDNPPRFDGEANVPGDHWHWPLLEVSGWSSWAEVASFVATLWADALADDTAAIAAQAAVLAHQVDRAQATLAAIRFVQEDVRYLAVDFGHGAGMLPNGAGTVLRRRFGDCKDKSVLLTALLRAMGVDACPVLVAAHWRHGVTRLLPSTSAFDHAIVRIDVDGRHVFVDPTFIGQRGDLAHRVAPPYGVGLELDSATTGLVELPPPTPTELSLTETFELDRRGNGQVAQTLHVEGSFADDLRATLLRDGRQAFVKGRVDALQQRFPALAPETAATEFDDDAATNRIVMRARHGLPTWGKPDAKPPAFFNYGAYGLLLGLDTIDDKETRRQPWALRYPMRLHHRVVVRGRCVHRSKPSRYATSGPGFRFHCEVTSKRRETTFDYRWETTSAVVPVTEWADYCREREKALDQTGALVNTQRLTFRQGLRTAIAVLIALWWIAQLAVREHGGASPRLDQAEYKQAQQDAGDAKQAMQRGDLARAYALLAPIERYYRDNFDMQAMHAEAALRAGHFEEAHQSLGRARQLKPEHPVVALLEATEFEVKGDFAAARARLLKAHAATTDDRILFALARVTERAGDFATARTTWEKVLSRMPAQPEALYSLAHLLWMAGEHTHADQMIVNAVRAQPAPSAVLESTLARYYAATGRADLRLTAARRAAELAPDDPLMVREHAMAQITGGERSAAVTTAQAMTKRFVDNPLAWSALATAAAVAQQYDLARPAFLRWLELAPTDPDAPSSYGYFLHRVGENEQGRAVLERGLEQFPAHGALWLNYAVVLEALRDPAADAARRKAAALMTPEQKATLVR